MTMCLSSREVMEVTPLPKGTTSRQDAFMEITRVLTLAKGRATNIYTDSKYACNIAHPNA